MNLSFTVHPSGYWQLRFFEDDNKPKINIRIFFAGKFLYLGSTTLLRLEELEPQERDSYRAKLLKANDEFPIGKYSGENEVRAEVTQWIIDGISESQFKLNYETVLRLTFGFDSAVQGPDPVDLDELMDQLINPPEDDDQNDS
ncbi:MAG TPA: hypothetical protein PKC18_18495 [Lacipirellulaceae bacterium]|nr:hypothetical protein [Lacipirellulaceae bacterium]